MLAESASRSSSTRAVVEMPERLTRPSVSAVASALVEACRSESPTAVLVDVTSIEHVDPHGLAALVRCRRRASALGVSLTFSAPSPKLREALASTGLLYCFRFRPAGDER
jgi:anti-anti-sigma factor